MAPIFVWIRRVDCVLIAVNGSCWIGVDRSMAVAYTFDNVLKAVGDFGSIIATLLDVTRLLRWAVVSVARESFGLMLRPGEAIPASTTG